jgi:hypothetical protein
MLGVLSAQEPERIHEHERPRAPEHGAEPAEDAAGALRELVANDPASVYRRRPARTGTSCSTGFRRGATA